MGLNNHEIKEIKITFKMASLNPKYVGKSKEIIRILADEYNVPFERVHKIIFGTKANEKIGTNLRILRMKRNLTQQEVAECLGLYYQTICYWENNKNAPKSDNLEKLANFYGVNVEEITEGNC